MMPVYVEHPPYDHTIDIFRMIDHRISYRLKARRTIDVVDTIDLTDLDNFVHGFPHPAFDRLRAEAPVYFHPPTPHTPGGEGFWVVSRYADILAVANDPATFSSETGGNRGGGGTTLEDMPRGLAVGVLLNMMDDPRHAAYRQLLTPSVSARALRKVEDDLTSRADAIVAAAVAKSECDFLEEVAAELPLQAVAQLLGVPQEDRHQLFDWINASLDYADRNVGETSESSERASAEMFQYGAELLARKRAADPTEDLLSIALRGRPGGEPLSDMEAQMLFLLVIAAGSETTRNSIALGVLALSNQPDTWKRLQDNEEDRGPAVEEILRWASTTPYNRRTATCDTAIGAQSIREGDKVTIWWASANRDEEMFADPHTFDIDRRPNRHLAFGRGSHHCLGAALARMEIRVMLDTLLRESCGIELTGPVEYVRSNKHSGVRHMPARLRR